MTEPTPTPELKCPTCKEVMRRGFELETDEMGQHPARWMEGPPTKGQLAGLSHWGGLSNRLDLTRTREIVVFRCPRCGLLQQYAP